MKLASKLTLDDKKHPSVEIGTIPRRSGRILYYPVIQNGCRIATINSDGQIFNAKTSQRIL